MPSAEDVGVDFNVIYYANSQRAIKSIFRAKERESYWSNS